MESRQGRKACTLITVFGPFLVVDAQEMADDLRKTCAGATSGMSATYDICNVALNSTQVAPIPGKPPGSGLEVLVQGKQSKAIVEYLHSKGIQKRWIEVLDLLGKK